MFLCGVLKFVFVICVEYIKVGMGFDIILVGCFGFIGVFYD